MNQNPKIRELKEKIADLKEYISSDFCKNCVSIYNEINKYEQEIKSLENDQNPTD